MNQMKNQQKEEVKNLVVAMLLVTIILFLFNPFSSSKQSGANVENSSENIVQIEQIKAEENTQKEIAFEKKAAPVLMKNDFVETLFDPALGGFNSLSLLQYKETLDKDSKNVTVLNDEYYTSLLWKSREVSMPHQNSFWQEDAEKSTSQKKVFVFKNNDVKIEREISLDDKYMLTIKDTVTNLTSTVVKAYQEGVISRKMEKNPPVSTVHQGFVGYLNDYLVEEKYDTDKVIFSDRSKDGWFGFTDKYWQSLIVLNPNENVSITFGTDKDKTYKAYFETDNFLIQPNASVSKTVRLFVGAKDIDVINAYQKNQNITHFDLSIDFGWFRFLTQPFLHFLNMLYDLLGNMGVAILVFATLIRFALLPIATKSYESMAKMRKLQPKIKSLQVKFKKDPRRLQIEMANLYKREKINPASGCLPLLLQIPVFFALYKVLSISINMRQAPFFGWIQDLSMPDPLTPFNGFGYFDITLPGFLTIGVLPILMGITMFIQQKMSPAPADKSQARMMLLLPVIFTLMMGSFASGLIIYWTWSNILSIFQQKYIMKKVGVE